MSGDYELDSFFKDCNICFFLLLIFDTWLKKQYVICLINFLCLFYFRKVNKCYRGRSCPVVVHCRQVQFLK